MMLFRLKLDPGRLAVRCSRILRVCVLCVLTSLSGVLYAAESYSQTKISVNMKNATVKDVFREIERGSEFIFFYNDDAIDDSRRVDVAANGITVSEILDRVLDPATTGYTVADRQVTVFRRAAEPVPAPVQAPQQQARTVTGTVIGTDGEPLVGATVIVDGTTTATFTTTDGSFSIRVPDGGMLRFQLLGYTTKTEALNGRSVVDVVLESSVTTIDDVVIVGFSTQTKGNLTGSFGIATAEDIKDRPVMFASQMLQGLVPGLNITQTNGALGESPSINVRGRGGIASGNNDANGVTDPIVLIDGIEGDINRINPNDIDNVTVLKDAAAASIYGSKAAFGVILVTTKRGAQGKTRVNYSNNFRWSTPTKLPETPDSVTFAAFYNDNLVNGGGGVHFNDTWMKAIVDFQTGKFANTIYKNGGTTEGKRWGEGFDAWGVDPNGSDVTIGGFNNLDYYDELFKKYAFTQEHNLSISGAQGRVNYYTSVNYADQSGLLGFGHDNYERYSVNARVGYQVLDWIDFTYNVRFNRDVNDRPTHDYGWGDVGRQTWPMLPLYDGNGKLRARLPLRAELGGNTVTRTDNLTQRIQIVAEPIANWRTTLEGAYVTRYVDNHRVSFPTYGGDGGHWDVDGNLIPRTSGESSIQENATFRDQFTMNLFSEYSFKVAEKHNFKVMAGLQQVTEQSKGYGIQKRGVMFEDLQYIGLTSDTNMAGNQIPPTLAEAHLWKTAMYGIFGRINYDYQRRYLFEANLRYDETSRFRAGHRAVWAPSVSAGWNIAEENFMTSTRGWIDMLKIRGSYGTIANQNTRGNYPTYTNMGIGAGGNGGNWWWNGASRPNQASSPGTLENPYMVWSKVITADIGLDFALLGDRLSGSFDWFSRRNTDQMGSPLRQPAVIGVSPPYTNSLESRDTGFDFSIGWNDRLANGFSYGIRAMLSDYTTTVMKFPNNPTGAIDQHYPGQKVGNIWGYVTKGMAKTKEEMEQHLAHTNQDVISGGGRWGAGDIMYTDLNGNGRIDRGASTLNDPGDRKIIGNDTPRYAFSIDLTAQWKGFDFRAFFQGVGKRNWHAPTNSNNESFFWGGTGNVWWQNCFTAHLDSWRDEETWSVQQGYMEPNTDDPYFAKPKGGGYNIQYQTRYLQDASYIRLKNLQIGYTLPSQWTKKASIDQVRVFFSGENLLTITRLFEIYDPETLFGGSSSGSIYPISRVLSFGVNLTF